MTTSRPITSFRRRPASAWGSVGRAVLAACAVGTVAACAWLVWMELDPDRRDEMRTWPVMGSLLAAVDPVPGGDEGEEASSPGRASRREASARVDGRGQGSPGAGDDTARREAIGRLVAILPTAMADEQMERSERAYRALDDALKGLEGDTARAVLDARFWRGVAATSLGRNEEGERELEDLALRFAMAPAMHHLIIHYYDQGRYDRALYFLDLIPESRRQGQGAAEMRHRIRNEKPLLEDFKTIESERCRVRYPWPGHAHHAQVATAECDVAYARIQEALDLPLTTRKLNVVLLDDDAYRTLADGMPDWATGWFSWRAFVSESRMRNDSFLRETVRHELVHGMLWWAHVRPPAWLDEGLAEYFESGGERPGRLVAWEDEVAAGRIRPARPRAMPDCFGQIGRAAEADTAYLHAASLAHHLVERHGRKAVRAVLMGLRGHGDVERALSDAIGTGSDGLHATWLASLKKARRGVRNPDASAPP